MINVLINAYAVAPNWGSEQGLGWNWVINLAKYCNVHVITEGEWRKEIEEAVDKLPHKANLHFYYNPLPDKVRRMCWNQGDWRFYWHYRKWQEKTLEIAREIINHQKIDIIHQLNMIGFREPGSLWKIDGIPFVWGPIGAMKEVSLGYTDGLDSKAKFKLWLKNHVSRWQMLHYPLSKNAMKRAVKVLGATSEVGEFIRTHHRKDVIVMNETGCYVKETESIKKSSDSFSILWVGKFDYRKQLPLAIKTVASLHAQHPELQLHVAGSGTPEQIKEANRLAEQLNCANAITFHGKIPNTEVHQLMKDSDLFLFTSIDEGTPHVVLEAIQNNLPVVCFDTCGQGDVVNDKIGVKIPVTNTRQSVHDFSTAISKLIASPETLQRFRENCHQRQQELSWDNKIRQMVNIYKDVLSWK